MMQKCSEMSPSEMKYKSDVSLSPPPFMILKMSPWLAERNARFVWLYTPWYTDFIQGT